MIYLDNSATTPLSDGAKNKITQMLDVFGNPSSLHSAGFIVEKELNAAREIIASSFGARTQEVYFTSSGTESDNIAILGAAAKNSKVGKRIITTDSEHPAVARTMDYLESNGYTVIRLSTRGGAIDMNELNASLSDDIALVSIMRVNNETGAVYDVPSIAKAVKRASPRVIIHSDCVQAYLKEKITLASLGADILSVSAHKVHAPKGTGVLLLKKGLVIPPHTYGGGQEKGIRSGTENTLGIAAMAASVAELMSDTSRTEKLRELYEYAVQVLSAIDGVSLNIPEKASCAVLNFSLEGYRSETVLHKLSSMGIFVSSGSACSAKKGRSGVLEAFGLSERRTDSAIRTSFSHYNTKEEIDALALGLEEVKKTIAKVK